MNDITCPCCGFEFAANMEHVDIESTCVQDCPKCEEPVAFFAEIFWHFSSEEHAPCVNDESLHKWEPRRSWPKICSRMTCSVCEEEREPTEDEWLEILGKPFDDAVAEYRKEMGK